MSTSSSSGTEPRDRDPQLTSVVERVAYSHPEVPKVVLVEMAETALAKTANAPLQGLRMPLAQHDVTEQAIAWERLHGCGGH